MVRIALSLSPMNPFVKRRVLRFCESQFRIESRMNVCAGEN
jgi:hypothetical protein